MVQGSEKSVFDSEGAQSRNHMAHFEVDSVLLHFTSAVSTYQTPGARVLQYTNAAREAIHF